MSQSDLDLTTDKKTGPVECLGQTFESDAARRAHYTELLREKLKDPEFRKIEGFPIGEDEDILNLSDPPYYTACPNPWIGDFIKAYGRPYDAKEKYNREPFAADVSEGKNHPIYKAHSYHTKVPHRAIMRYILHYTNPGDVVFDGFCGTGMTGVAAQFCGDEKEVRELGYRVDPKGVIYDEEGKAFSKLGARRAVLNDLSPAATFIAYNYNTPVDVDAFEHEAKRILGEVEAECGWMYQTKHNEKIDVGIDYTVWSDCLLCPECGNDFVFLAEALDADEGKVLSEFKCPTCEADLTKKRSDRSFESYYDELLELPEQRIKREPVIISYRVGKVRHERPVNQSDLDVLKKINLSSPDLKIPLSIFPFDDMWEATRLRSKGVTHVHHLFSDRTLNMLSSLWGKVLSHENDRIRKFLIFWIDQSLMGFSWLNRYRVKTYSHVNNYMSGVYLKWTPLLGPVAVRS